MAVMAEASRQAQSRRTLDTQHDPTPEGCLTALAVHKVDDSF